jgi:hypothetical protein
VTGRELRNAGKFCGESRHDLDDVIMQLNERWEKRLKIPISEVSERYCRNDLGVVLNLSLPLSLGDYSLLITHDALHDNIVRKCDSTSTAAQDEFSMFVRNIHFVKDEKGVIEQVGGVVRLKPLNQATNGGVRNSLYLSFITGKMVFLPWPRFENGKFDIVTIFPLSVVGRGKLPDDVIQTGTQVMGDFAGQDAEAERNRTLLMVLASLEEKLHVILWNGGVFAFLEKPLNLDLKILDVFLGPF